MSAASPLYPQLRKGLRQRGEPTLRAKSRLMQCIKEATRSPRQRAPADSVALSRRRTIRPEVLETARDASEATAEVACGRKLCFDRLPRAVVSR